MIKQLQRIEFNAYSFRTDQWGTMVYLQDALELALKDINTGVVALIVINGSGADFDAFDAKQAGFTS